MARDRTGDPGPDRGRWNRAFEVKTWLVNLLGNRQVAGSYLWHTDMV